jgi:hypothetical protein
MRNAKVYSGLMSRRIVPLVIRRIISPSVYYGKIIFSREIRLSNVTLLLIHIFFYNGVCKRKKWKNSCNPNNGCSSTIAICVLRAQSDTLSIERLFFSTSTMYGRWTNKTETLKI